MILTLALKISILHGIFLNHFGRTSMFNQLNRRGYWTGYWNTFRQVRGNKHREFTDWSWKSKDLHQARHVSRWQGLCWDRRNLWMAVSEPTIFAGCREWWLRDDWRFSRCLVVADSWSRSGGRWASGRDREWRRRESDRWSSSRDRAGCLAADNESIERGFAPRWRRSSGIPAWILLRRLDHLGYCRTFQGRSGYLGVVTEHFV